MGRRLNLNHVLEKLRGKTFYIKIFPGEVADYISVLTEIVSTVELRDLLEDVYARSDNIVFASVSARGDMVKLNFLFYGDEDKGGEK